MGGTLVLPGQAIIGKHYGESMVLYTAGDAVECVVDGAPVGPDGRLFRIVPGKAKKVPFEAGRFILEHLAYTGVVRVEENETDSGVEYDIAGAKKASLVLLEAQDAKRFHDYISATVEDYVSKNKVVPPPSPPILAIIERRGYDLKKYGIKPIGFADPEQERFDAQAKENKDLKDELLALRNQMAALSAQVAADGKKKG